MVSERIRTELAKIAGRIPDGDEGSEEPLVAAWGDVVIGMSDADDLCECIELADVTISFIEKYGQEKGERLLKTFLRLLAVPGTVETLQMMERKEVET